MRMTFRPMTDDDFNSMNGIVREKSTTTVYSAIESNTMSSSIIFGSRDTVDTVTGRKTVARDNYRGYMILHKPVLNVLLTNKGTLMATYLGISNTLMKDIMDFKVIYDKKNKQLIDYINIKDLDISDCLCGAEILEMKLKEMNVDEQIDLEVRRLVHKVGFKDKVDLSDVGEVNKDKEGICVIGDYYIKLAEEGRKRKNIQDSEIEMLCMKELASHKDNRLVYLINAKKDTFLRAIVRKVALLPTNLMPKQGDKVYDPSFVMLGNILTSSNKLRNIEVQKGLLANYILEYKRLVRAYVDFTETQDNRTDPSYFSILRKLHGKKNLIRGKMIGKRNDYTSRSVVIPDPTLSITEIALPREMIAKVYLHHYLEKLAPEEIAFVKSKSADVIADEINKLGILDYVYAGMNRAPSLHTLSYLSYKVKVCGGYAIRVNPLVCEGYNMDFDGDTVGIHVPITPDGVREMRELMFTLENMFKPADGTCTLKPRLEMLYGLNIMTREEYPIKESIQSFSSLEELKEEVLKQNIKVYDTVTLNGDTNCAGRLLFKYILPADVRSRYTKAISKKTVGTIIDGLLLCGKNVFANTVDNMIQLAFKIATLYSPTTAVFTEVNKKLFTGPFERFEKEMQESIILHDKGFVSEKAYNRKYSELLAQAEKSIKESIMQALDGTELEPSVEMLNGLYMATRNKYKLDTESYDEDLYEVDDFEELEKNILTKIIQVDDTVIIGGVRYLAGRLLISTKSGKQVTEEITKNNVDQYLRNKEVVKLGFRISRLFPINRLSDKVKGYVATNIDYFSDGLPRHKNGFATLVEAGSRGTESNLIQMYSHKGRVLKGNGEVFNAVIRHSFSDFLYPSEHFITAYGSRKGELDKSVKPADTGYGERIMSMACDMIITEDDCGTTDGFTVRLKDLIRYDKANYKSEDEKIKKAKKTMAAIIAGRWEVGGTYVSASDAENIVESRDEITIRSPFKCKNKCCSKCYGIDLGIRGKAVKGLPVGVIAAQSIGEPGTQLVMKSFHAGGIAGGADAGSDYDIIERLFRKTNIDNYKKYPTYDPIAPWDGTIEMRPNPQVFEDGIISIGGKDTKIKYPYSAKNLLKKYVNKGEGICKREGDHALKEIEEYSSIDEAILYLVYQCYFTYKEQVDMNIKHFEILASAMEMYFVVSSSNKKIKPGMYYTQSELLSRGGLPADSKYIRVIRGAQDVPIVRASAAYRFLLERVEEGIARATTLELVETFDGLMPAVAFGLQPKIGTYYNNFIEERRKAGDACEII